MIICAACNQPIFERYLSQVLDKAWHNTCVKCSICNILLKDKCFTRDGRLFCRDDFMRIFGQKCTGCNQTIASNDLIRKARGKIFHINCFCCTYCQKRMDTGEELYIVGGCKFLCKKDFMNGQYQANNIALPTPLQNDLESECGASDLDADDDDLCGDDDDVEDRSLFSPKRSGGGEPSSPDSSADGNGGGLSDRRTTIGSADPVNGKCQDDSLSGNGGQNGAKRRGPRTTIKAKQLETLKAAFSTTPKPTRHIREQLAQETGLNMRVIQVWFQNRRSKERRMKQLRYGGFRPGSRRVRNALLRDDPSMIGDPNGLYPDGLPRPEDAYYHHAMSYYCDVFGNGDHPNGPRLEMAGLLPPGGGPSAPPPPGAPFMMPPMGHPDDLGSNGPMDHNGNTAYMMDRSHESQDDNQSSLGAAADNGLRHQQHPYLGTMLMNAAKSDVDHGVLNLPSSVRW